jgi:hypothetical protein
MINRIAKYLWKNKLWWILPPLIIVLIFGALIVFSTVVPVAPFVYALF